MTAQPAPAKAERPVPRPLIKTFWAIHRAIVRVSGGRVGFRTPEAGKTFGMARLTTIGRRSGRTRVAMIGYYEDGPNLVTLAMNGWARTGTARRRTPRACRGSGAAWLPGWASSSRRARRPSPAA